VYEDACADEEDAIPAEPEGVAAAEFPASFFSESAATCAICINPNKIRDEKQIIFFITTPPNYNTG
jgi:hypothetical protein